MRIACVLAACLAVAVPVAAQAGDPLPVVAPAAEGFSAQRLERLDRFMRDATDADGYLGGVVLVARNGRLVTWRAYGSRDLARSEPMQRDDIFRLYSMTKTVATVAVLILLEEGKLTLDDPISRYLPGFDQPMVMAGGSADAPQLRAATAPLTLHALLTHTAGFPAGVKGDEEAVRHQERIDPRGAADLRGFAERMARVPLAADPGKRFGYDGAALELAARVVEVVSGMPFEQFLRERIFDPLRMRDTGFRVPQAARTRVVDITTMGDDGKLRLDSGPSAVDPGEPLNAYTSAAGGLYSTAADYARFAQMLLDGGELDGARVLGRKTVEMMLRNQLTMLDPPVTQFSDSEGFGLGGYVVLGDGRRGQPASPGQFGWPGAASTTYFIDPKERLLAIMLLQHLPRGGVRDLPRISRNFQAVVYQGLVR